jgi:glycerol-3-phosphate acyltransferase PlsY
MSPWLCALPVAAYLYGSVPFGFLAARLLKGVDIRTTGSGNIGATNAARVLGFRFFPLIFLLDMSKGALPAFAAAALVSGGVHDPHPFVVGTGLATILGHVYPVYLGFKGGKAVATSSGFFLVVAPVQLLIAAGTWAIVFAIWRYVSLASISAAAALPLAVCLMERDPFGAGIYVSAVSILGGLFVIYLHRANIGRLLAGKEGKVGRGGGASPAA